MVTFKLHDDFMMGTATASTQIEGGDTNNTWYHWCEAGHISDNSSSFTACNHWVKHWSEPPYTYVFLMESPLLVKKSLLLLTIFSTSCLWQE